MQVSAGVFHSLFLDIYGRVYAAGGNNFGQLGLGNKTASYIPLMVESLKSKYITKISASHHSAAIDDKGGLYVWGTGSFGTQLLPIKFNDDLIKATDVQIGGCSGMMLSNGRIYSWGINCSGELGVSDYEIRENPCLIEGFDNVELISQGNNFAFASINVKQYNKNPSAVYKKNLKPKELEEYSPIKPKTIDDNESKLLLNLTTHSKSNDKLNENSDTKIKLLTKQLAEAALKNEILEKNLVESQNECNRLRRENSLFSQSLKALEGEAVNLRKKSNQMELENIKLVTEKAFYNNTIE